MNCINCEAEIDVEKALSDSLCSWPNRQTIYCTCPSCKHGNQLKFRKGVIQNVKVIGAPGPETQTVKTVSDELVEDVVNDFGDQLNIWYNKKPYSIVARV